MEAYTGEIRLWTSVRIPTGWANCDGSTLLIAEYEVLYSLIGTVWGGDGRTNFKLPDLRGRLPVGQGNGAGLAPAVFGQSVGTETVTLTTDNLPVHNHSMTANTTTATATAPTSASVLAAGAGQDGWYASGSPLNKSVLANDALANAGGSQPHPNVMPCLAATYIICTNGLYPTRNS